MVVKNVCNSVYIHIPFCKKICSYCNFCKFIYNDLFISKYLDSLKNEIKNNYKGEIIKTIYIGGGTPSSLSIEDLKRLLEINKVFNLDEDIEYTIEFNVEDINDEKMKLLKEYNVNRLSIGVESFNKNILKYLNRNYNTSIIDKVNIAKKYFDNINIDLIYAVKDQDLKMLEEDLKIINELDINHVSCYSLIIEKHTKLFNDKTKPIDDELDFKMYKLINKMLKDFNHYEISNYAKSGYESKHNLVYWNNEEYYGFGVGAASYKDSIRKYNSKSLNKYLNQIYDYEEEILSKEDKISYELILGFRKTKGINIKAFYDKYNVNITDLYNISELVNEKKLIIKNGYIFINDKYLYTENEILLNFV